MPYLPKYGPQDLARLLEHLDQDERIAEGAARTGGRRWYGLALQSPFDARVDDHIVRHDPARALREVAAKRALLEGLRLPAPGAVVAAGHLRRLVDLIMDALAASYNEDPEQENPSDITT